MSSPEGRPRVQVHPGAGLVVRRGDALLVVPVLPPGSREPVRALAELCSRPDPGEAPLHALIDRWPAAQVPAFAWLVRAGNAVRVLVHGEVRVLVDDRPLPRPDERLAEHVVEDGVWQGLAVLADGDAAVPEAADPLGLVLDLDAGAVPGGGVTLRAAAEVPEPERARSETSFRPAVRFRTVPLGECAFRLRGGRPGPARRPPLPVAAAAERPGQETGTDAVVVEGVRCPHGHFTDPDRPACLTCGAPVASGGQRFRLPRPPLGILVTDGGTIVPVTGDLVIGREPEHAPDVLAGRARPLPLHDAERSISRHHARLTVRGWRVLLGDDGSANGTFISGHGPAGPWLPATAESPIPLTHGDRIRLGRRQLLFDAWRESVVPQAFR